MRIGVLGGTFNPIHNAHLDMARRAKRACKLDRVLLMVAADPPHKVVDGHVDAATRLTMARLAATGEDGIEACDLELRRAGKSYTRDTLLSLNALYPDAELFLIVGSDTLADFPNWHCPNEVLSLATVIAVPRRKQNTGDAEAAALLERRYGARVVLLDDDVGDVSSTCVRERLFAGLPVEALLPAAVERYCYEEGIYFSDAVRALQEKMRGVLTAKRFCHVAGTMRAAAVLAESWGADPKKAQIAALLHDCAKAPSVSVTELETLSGDEQGVPAVYHAFAGAVLARVDYGVTDDEILRAIRLHTASDEKMRPLDLVTYAADLIEPNRAFSGVDELRAAAKGDAEAFMLHMLTREIRRLEAAKQKIHPAARRALRWYQQRLEQNDGTLDKTKNGGMIIERNDSTANRGDL